MKVHEKLFSLILCAILGALIFALKLCMAALPNIEPVTLLLMLFTLLFGARAFASAVIYILLEGLVYGFSPWWFCYIYIWTLLVIITLPLRRYRSRFLFAAVAGVFGFVFGFFFIPVFYFTYDLEGRLIPYILADIPFDLIHAGANVVIVFCLLPPLRRAFEKVLGAVGWEKGGKRLKRREKPAKAKEKSSKEKSLKEKSLENSSEKEQKQAGR